MLPTYRGQFISWGKDDMLIDIDVVGDFVAYTGKDHVRLSKDDWKKIKTRLMRTTTEETYGNAEIGIKKTEAGNVGLDPNPIF